MTAAELDLYDIAFLAGGPDRVVDTAVVALLESGRLRVHRTGQLATVDVTRRHPVEAAVLDAVGPTGHRSIDTIRWRLADDDRIGEVGRRLVGAGLVARWSPARRRRRPPVRTPAGRRALREWTVQPPPDSGCAVQVALHGQDRMDDERLRAAVFDPPPVPVPGDSARAMRRRIDAARSEAENELFSGRGGFVSGGGDGGAF